MTTLSELYQKKQNFASYRTVREQELLGGNTEATPLVRQLEAVQLERKEFLLHSDHRIGQLKLDIAKLGVPTTKTERKRWVDAQIRDEKADVDQSFALEVKSRMDAGAAVADLVKECGAKSPSIFYNATKGLTGSYVSENRTSTAPPVDISETVWEYSTHRPVHRYAFNSERTLVRFHAVDPEEAPVVLTYPSGTYYAGNRELEDAYHAGRAHTLLQILEGHFVGDLRHETNQFKTK